MNAFASATAEGGDCEIQMRCILCTTTAPLVDGVVVVARIRRLAKTEELSVRLETPCSTACG